MKCAYACDVWLDSKRLGMSGCYTDRPILYNSGGEDAALSLEIMARQ